MANEADNSGRKHMDGKEKQEQSGPSGGANLPPGVRFGCAGAEVPGQLPVTVDGSTLPADGAVTFACVPAVSFTAVSDPRGTEEAGGADAPR
jgi:hypothetical protein